MDDSNLVRRTFRLPPDAVSFLEAEAKRNLTSQNAEVVRAIRERLQRVTALTAPPTTTELRA